MGRTITGEKRLEARLKEVLLQEQGEKKEISAVIIGCKSVLEIREIKYTQMFLNLTFQPTKISSYTVSESRFHLLDVAVTPNDKDECNRSIDRWISDHAGQVSSTLPGGVEVLGVAVSLKPAQIKAMQPRLRGLLYSVWRKSQCGVKQWLECGGSELQILVHYSYESKRLRYQALEVTNSQSIFSIGSEIKFQTSPHPLIELTANFTFDSEKLSSDSDMKILLQDGVQVCSDIVLTSICTHNGEIPSCNSTISDLLVRSSQSVKVDVFYKLPPVPDKVEVIREGYCMTMTESIQCRAYVTAKTSWQQAIKVLKLDALKSLKNREEALLLELEDQELSSGRKHCMLKLPRRVWLRDNTLTWLLCDYCFPNEREQEAVDSVCKIWGERDMAVHSEEMLCEETIEPQAITTTPAPPIGRRSLPYVMLGSVLILLLAIALGSWLL